PGYPEHSAQVKPGHQCSSRDAHVEIGQSTLVLYLIQGMAFRLMDSIPYAEPLDLTSKLAVAGILGAAIVLVALMVRRTVHDIPYLSQLILGTSPPRPMSSGAACG
ncbi:hypothetical protein QJT79_44625, partial [Bradyrhizobium sp. Mp64]|nr:hypothetical protein [Bradyrhizobium sp. Mp64]